MWMIVVTRSVQQLETNFRIQTRDIFDGLPSHKVDWMGAKLHEWLDGRLITDVSHNFQSVF